MTTSPSNRSRAAFGVGVHYHPEAMAMMAARYKPGEFNAARQRMALVPVGAELVRNSVSTAPGVHIGNVFVMAGVPMIMRAMLDAVEPLLRRGAVVHAATVQTKVPEGKLAAGLEAIQKAHKDVAIGSYPFYREGGSGVQLVARGRDKAEVETAANEDRSHGARSGSRSRPGNLLRPFTGLAVPRDDIKHDKAVGLV